MGKRYVFTRRLEQLHLDLPEELGDGQEQLCFGEAVEKSVNRQSVNQSTNHQKHTSFPHTVAIPC